MRSPSFHVASRPSSSSRIRAGIVVGPATQPGTGFKPFAMTQIGVQTGRSSLHRRKERVGKGMQRLDRGGAMKKDDQSGDDERETRGEHLAKQRKGNIPFRRSPAALKTPISEPKMRTCGQPAHVFWG